MKYEIVTLEEKIAVGISARTNNLSPDMGAVIGGLWNRFYNEGIYASIPKKTNEKALGIYTDFTADEKADYTTVVACETSEEPPQEMHSQYTVCRIPAGRYARFIVHGSRRLRQLGRRSGRWIFQGLSGVILKNIRMTVWIRRRSISMWD